MTKSQTRNSPAVPKKLARHYALFKPLYDSWVEKQGIPPTRLDIAKQVSKDKHWSLKTAQAYIGLVAPYIGEFSSARDKTPLQVTRSSTVGPSTRTAHTIDDVIRDDKFLGTLPPDLDIAGHMRKCMSEWPGRYRPAQRDVSALIGDVLRTQGIYTSAEYAANAGISQEIAEEILAVAGIQLRTK